jgi:hypothetical protein
MNDTSDDDERARRQAVVLELRRSLEEKLWVVVNDPEAQWARVPHVAAESLAEVLLRVLAVMAVTDPAKDFPFGLRLIAQLEQLFIAQTRGTTDSNAPPASAAPSRTH